MISAQTAAEIRRLLDQLRAVVDAAAAQPAPAAPAPPHPPPPAVAAKPKDASGFFADHGRFYDFLRGNKMLGPTISADEFEGCEAIVIGFGMAGAPVSYVAYGLATAKLRALGFDVDLVANPDLAMRPDLAAVIMVHGMIEGWFTGRQLDDDLLEDGPSTRQHFVDSRDIINGRDKQHEIAGFAVDFQTGLLAAGYRPLAGARL